MDNISSHVILTYVYEYSVAIYDLIKKKNRTCLLYESSLQRKIHKYRSEMQTARLDCCS